MAKENIKQNKILIISAIVVLIIAVIAIIGLYFFVYLNKTSLVKGKVIINNKTISVEVAQTPGEQLAGLSGREKLTKNSGMLFVFADKRYHDFWMKGMKFPLDIIWIADDKIIDLTKNAPVPTENQKDLPVYHPQSEVNYVLEVNAGFADANNVKVGDKVVIILSK